MLDPVMYDLNKHLAEEDKWIARDERLEEIAAEIRKEKEFFLQKAPIASAVDEVGNFSDFIDEKALHSLMMSVYRDDYLDIRKELLKIFNSAVDDYICELSHEELRRLEEVEAENAALAGV